MSTICIIDTSVFLNILDVPNRNDQREEVFASFEEYIQLEATFILPMATIVETGNHIAQNGNGAKRREVALKFCEQVEAALNDKAPYKVSEFPKPKEVLEWLGNFPQHAGTNKSTTKPNEGTSFGDLSIIEEFNKCVDKFSMSEVFIWSLDSDLAAYHRGQP